MKHLSLFIAFIFVVAVGAAGCGVRAAARTRPAAPAQRGVVDISVFYDELAPYGRWFTLDGYGWVWTPYGVSASWRPYTYGYWVYTDYGWTWVSRWRWGWAPFHYGRGGAQTSRLGVEAWQSVGPGVGDMETSPRLDRLGSDAASSRMA